MLLRRFWRWLFSREVLFCGAGDVRWRTRVKYFTEHSVALQLRRRFFLWKQPLRVELNATLGIGTVYLGDQIYGYVWRLN